MSNDDYDEFAPISPELKFVDGIRMASSRDLAVLHDIPHHRLLRMVDKDYSRSSQIKEVYETVRTKQGKTRKIRTVMLTDRVCTEIVFQLPGKVAKRFRKAHLFMFKVMEEYLRETASAQ